MASVARSVRRRRHIEDWKTLAWKEIERNVFRLQQRIYRAERRGDYKQVHNLQRLLLRSWSARCLAVRRVSQDNRGKRTPGVDGVANLTPKQRMVLVEELRNLSNWQVDAIRRTHIEKRGTAELRGLGIPTMSDRACQALAKLALEPEWEAKFEPNSYGFRPGRSAHDAIEAIFNHIRLKPKYVLDADIEKCFDNIAREPLEHKLNAIGPIARLVQDWLRTGILDGGKYLFPEAGVPQGGVISPLLCNVALHGFEKALISVSKRYRIAIIRYADDLVILCEDLETLLKVKREAETWLAEVGLRLKPSKTRVTHTLNEHEGNVGFDFLGFNIRQHRVGRYHTRTYRGKPGFKTLIEPSKKAYKRQLEEMREVIRRHKGAPQAALVKALNSKTRGWTQYHCASVAKKTFDWMDAQLFHKLYRWARFRHPRKTGGWCVSRYWKRKGERLNFGDGKAWLAKYADTPIKRHVKVRGDKSPYDGDWPYWIQRRGRDPTKPTRVLNLLKRQKCHCGLCGLYFKAEDVIEMHHWDSNRMNDRYANLVLLHGHCHDEIHGKEKCQ
jgi:RNA-directed DNA polymerase